MKIFEQLIPICSNLLYEHPLAVNALNYLNKRLSKNIQRKFNFGFFPSQEQLNILFSFIDKKILLDNELLYEDSNSGIAHNIFTSPLQHHNLILPYKDVYGKIIAIVGRSLLEDSQRNILGIAKYKNTSFKKSKHLFGLYEAKKSILDLGHVYIVEGQFDCIQAHNHNIQNIVALGSSNMSLEQLILLLRYTNDLRLILDNDEAGEMGRNRILEKYGKYTNICNRYVPSGFKDLDEFLKEETSITELETCLNKK